MRIFALVQDLSLDTNKFHRQYLGVGDLQTLQLENLYLDVGDEPGLISERLKLDTSLNPSHHQAPGLRFIQEDILLVWPHFPTRLGRMSTRLMGNGLYLHPENSPLPAQLQALRIGKPDKQYWRVAIVHGFGSNLGDCTIGITAFRVVLQCLRQHLPSLSCDILFGPGTSRATTDILSQEPEVERVLFHTLSVADFSQYDAYFDFTDLTNTSHDELSAVDWILWWCGLAPQDIPPEHKRNQGHIRQDAWQAVQALLRDQPSPKVLFNPKASTALRSMPKDVALRFVQRLLELAPSITWVLDQPMDCKHPRLLDLSGQIDSPEKFKALIGHMDGVITVDTFAIHQADISATPTVTLFSSVAPTAYPYYPNNVGIGIPGYTTLPAYKRPKVADEEWEKIKDAYHAAWANLKPAEVLALLHEKMAQRQAAPEQRSGLSLVEAARPPASYVTLEGTLPHLKRQRLAPVHAYASERFPHLTQALLKPGSVCVMACAPDAGLALVLAQRIAPHGELIVLEPRAPLARNVEAALHLAGAPCTARVLQAVSLGGVAQARINVLNAWSESHSTEWGNLPAVTAVPSQPLDTLALQHCNALLVQSPMHYELFIRGTLETLQRCRPLILMTPVSKEEAAAVCKLAQSAHYDFWAEAALPGMGSATEAGTLLLVGIPREQPLQWHGLTQIALN